MIERGLAGLNSAMAANYENLAPAQRRVIDKLVEDKRYAAISTLPDISRDLIPCEVCLRHSIAGCQKASTQRSCATQRTEDDLFACVFPRNNTFDEAQRRV